MGGVITQDIIGLVPMFIESAAPAIAVKLFGETARAATVTNLALSAASAIAASPDISESSISAFLAKEADLAVAKALAPVAPWAVSDVVKFLNGNIPGMVQEAAKIATAKIGSLAGKL